MFCDFIHQKWIEWGIIHIKSRNMFFWFCGRHIGKLYCRYRCALFLNTHTQLVCSVVSCTTCWLSVVTCKMCWLEKRGECQIYHCDTHYSVLSLALLWKTESLFQSWTRFNLSGDSCDHLSILSSWHICCSLQLSTEFGYFISGSGSYNLSPQISQSRSWPSEQTDLWHSKETFKCKNLMWRGKHPVCMVNVLFIFYVTAR